MRSRAGILAAALLVLTGCVPGTPEVVAQDWTRVDLPAGFEGSQLLVADGRLVVGGLQDDAPAILVGEDADDLAPIPVEATSFYGAVARWYALVADGSELRALGGRTGGGHGNPRWSTWRGDLDGLAERNTPGIEVFGGWRGGGMVGVAVADGQAVIVGGRAGDAAGLDIAVWLEQGDDWVEQPSAGTPLGATDDRLPFPTSVVGDGSRLLITGFTQRLGGGEVRVEATAWFGAPTGPWERVDLPSEAAESRADAAACEPEGCVIVGHGDGGLLAWRYAGGAVTPLPVPVVDAPEDVVAPVTWDGSTAVLGPGLVGVSTDLTTWRLLSGPDGAPLAATSADGILYVLVTAGDGSVELWRSPESFFSHAPS